MTASQAMIAYGSKWSLETVDSPNQSPPDWHEMGEVFNITPPNAQVDDVDVTHNQSPNRTREFIAGLNDPGEASFEINWVPGSATDTIINALKDAGTVVSHKIDFPNGLYWEFTGYVKGFEPTMQTEDKMTATVTVKVSGAVTRSYS